MNPFTPYGQSEVDRLRNDKEKLAQKMRDYENYFDLMERSNKIPLCFDQWLKREN